MKRLDTTGMIIKKEKLASFQSSVPVHELILEDLAPFPGYYGSFYLHPHEKELMPSHLFLVLKTFDYFNDDEFVRNTLRIRSGTGLEFDAVPGQLQLFNETHPCIRIRTQHLESIPALIDAFKSTGVDFARHREVRPYDSLIKIKTFFPLEEIQEGIFHDTHRPEFSFITIPYMPDWETFEEITLSIRRNSEYRHYDAALACAFARQGVIEMVRIYDRSCSLAQLQDLKNKYHRELDREQHK